jgi:hypothetical protein
MSRVFQDVYGMPSARFELATPGLGNLISLLQITLVTGICEYSRLSPHTFPHGVSKAEGIEYASNFVESHARDRRRSGRGTEISESGSPVQRALHLLIAARLASFSVSLAGRGPDGSVA